MKGKSGNEHKYKYHTRISVGKIISQLQSVDPTDSILNELLVVTEQAVRDKTLLDFLDSHGTDWTCRHSNLGRGYRVHQTSNPNHDIQPSARKAIENAMLKSMQKDTISTTGEYGCQRLVSWSKSFNAND